MLTNDDRKTQMDLAFAEFFGASASERITNVPKISFNASKISGMWQLARPRYYRNKLLYATNQLLSIMRRHWVICSSGFVVTDSLVIIREMLKMQKFCAK